MREDKSVAKEEYKKRVAELEQKNSDMKRRMQDYQDGGNEKWQLFKTEFNRDMKNLQQSLSDFFKNEKKR